MKVEIGFFFCCNCGFEVKSDVTYEEKPADDCIRCGMQEWIFEPTGERDVATK